ncbi:MAG: TRAP-type mannitol/chloroaromatic compound transport system permease small subunit [Oceanospirillaceae bacterium]|jgi:TRAP-type mannitol/chloroaromatic compound transport system permease small subunit
MNESTISEDEFSNDSPYIPYKSNSTSDKFYRLIAGSIVSITLVFLFNVYLTYWLKWPSMLEYLSQLQWFGLQAPRTALTEQAMQLGWWQTLSYIGAIMFVASFIALTPRRQLRADAQTLSAFARYIIRASFWAVFLVGLVDMAISFLRVEDLLHYFLDTESINSLGRPIERGANIHYPLMGLAMVIALFTRSLGFTWLALLVVIAEFKIVLLSFIFSYEQAFMGDLVRFWYAALFLFASSHTLVADGHVRVDVLYAGFTKKTKAWSNTLGLLLLGIPLCWVILTMGMWGKGNSINSPLISFEISQSGYGLYIKYMMVGYLVIFSLSMMVQFCSYLLSNIAELRNEPELENPTQIPAY